MTSGVRGDGSGDRDGSARPSSADEGSADFEVDDVEDFEGTGAYVERPWWARTSTLVVVVVALFAVSGAVTAWLRISDLQERVGSLEAQTLAAETARQDAILLAEDLATYDYRDLGGNFRLVAARATDRFAGQLATLTEELGPRLQQTRAVADATARSAGVVRADTTKAVVAVFVDQSVTNESTPEPRIERSRMELTLLREGGVWRLDQAGEL